MAFHLRPPTRYGLEISNREGAHRPTLFDITTGPERSVAPPQAPDAQLCDGAGGEELLEEHHAAVRDDSDVHASGEGREKSGEHGWGG